MNSRTNNSRRKSTTRTANMMEPMEARTMYSATPAVVGYLPDYRTNDALIQTLTAASPADHSSWGGLTQVNYFAVQPSAAGVMPGINNPAYQTSDGHDLTQLQAVVAAAHANGAKVNVVVGGWAQDGTLGDIIDSASSSMATVNAFAASLHDFANYYHVDGVDLDWEPLDHDLVNRGQLTKAEVANYGTVIRAIHTAGLTVSAAVNSSPESISGTTANYVLGATAVANLDQINVMDYDITDTSNGTTAQTEAIMADYANYLAAGHDANGVAVHGAKGQLVMGMPFYGNSANGPYTYADAVAANGGAAPTSDTPTLTMADGYTGTISLNTPATVATKTADALTNGYGGVMAWELGQDDGIYTGTLPATSLLKAMTAAVAANTATSNPVTPTPTPTPAEVQLTGSTISSYRFENNGPTANGHIADVSDGNLATGFYSNAATGWYGLALPAPAHVTRINIAPRNGHGWNMVGGTFQASNDPAFSTGNVTLADVTASPAAGVLTALTVTTPGTYSYVRYVAPAGSHGEAAEIQYVGTTSAAAPAATYAAQDRKAAPSVFADNAAAVVDSVK